MRQEAQQRVRDSEEQWTTVLQSAENTLKKAEVQYSLSRELEAFRAQAESGSEFIMTVDSLRRVSLLCCCSHMMDSMYM